ncbi:hypothetical protein ACLOJK_037656 [Asimina triloba]
MATPKSPSSPHIIMFPYMAQGHMIPLLALAKLLDCQTPYTITFISTPLNIKNLKSSLAEDTSINLISLPFSPSDHGLPSDGENTNSIPFHLFMALCQATETLQPAFHKLLTSISQQDCGPPLCIIGDVFLGWTVNVAHQLNIFHATFSCCGVYGTAAYFSLWLHLPHTKTCSRTFSLPGFPNTYQLHQSQLSSYLRAANGTDPWSIFIQRQMSLSLHSDGMICNGVEDMEVTGLQILRSITGLPIWCVGPLIPPSFMNHNSSMELSHGLTQKDPSISAGSCTSWLNLRAPRSVLYVSFGSQNTISSKQMMELGVGLEASGVPFIWVIRPPIGVDANKEFRAEWLPEGFEERITKSGQGILVKKWAPQVEILSHGATGVFMSHCGWNSTLESLSQGVPFIGWPIAAEQFYNAKMLEELGVCVEIGRGVEEMVSRKKVEEVIRSVIGGTEKGMEMQSAALKVGEMIKAAMRGKDGGEEGSSLAAINDFVSAAISKRRAIE